MSDQSTSSQCLFCGIVSGAVEAQPVFQNDTVVAFNDIYPQAPVHVLFVPRKHIATVNDIGDEDAEIVGQLFLAARDYARETGIADNGFRLIMNCNEHGGQTVFHLHLHLLAGKQLAAGFGA